MRIDSSCAFVLALGIFTCGSTPALADDSPAPSTGTTAMAEISAQIAQADAAVRAMAGARHAIEQRLDRARQERLVIASVTLADLASQMDVLYTAAQADRTALALSAKWHDLRSVEYRAALIRARMKRVTRIGNAAEALIGADIGTPGTRTSTTVTPPANLPDDTFAKP